jgi:YHS domain-containing protein
MLDEEKKNMADVKSLLERIDSEISAADERLKQFKTRRVEEFQGRQQRLEQFEKTLDRLSGIWRPRLEALAEKFGPRVAVEPTIEPARRSATFAFQSELARIALRFSVVPDSDVRNIVVSYDLDIIPVLMRFDAHDEITFPLDAVDDAALTRWMDDHMVGFVKTYLSLHENEYYLKDHMVEDPIAKVRFPKYAAGASLEKDGKTYYFISQDTRTEFQARHGTASKG